ncbi:hypothetical protein FRX31_014767 [Thalictrum thalictroides]|uniref:Uncharacterized protein n=1 Tax=Thalictrum thalictroides TaxID=46969 RepID=A0A7J6WFL6_THATH|nr:hypothetical protein FRX31_014767 [Thalictrum thalictroides]
MMFPGNLTSIISRASLSIDSIGVKSTRRTCCYWRRSKHVRLITLNRPIQLNVSFHRKWFPSMPRNGRKTTVQSLHIQA